MQLQPHVYDRRKAREQNKVKGGFFYILLAILDAIVTPCAIAIPYAI
jgi:hypothetical protein